MKTKTFKADSIIKINDDLMVVVDKEYNPSDVRWFFHTNAGLKKCTGVQYGSHLKYEDDEQNPKGTACPPSEYLFNVITTIGSQQLQGVPEIRLQPLDRYYSYEEAKEIFKAGRKYGAGSVNSDTRETEFFEKSLQGTESISELILEYEEKPTSQSGLQNADEYHVFKLKIHFPETNSIIPVIVKYK